jgi:Uma2 family endonuclease
MPPAPNITHQDLEWELELWLRTYWARPLGNRVHHNVNVAPPGGWPDDYRIPDLVLLTPDRFHIDRDEYLEGPPTVVVEIRSRGLETMEKLPFYARLGVPEVWVVERDSRVPELYALGTGRYEQQSPAADGWLNSAATHVRLRGEVGERLALQFGADESTRRLLPEGR